MDHAGPATQRARRNQELLVQTGLLLAQGLDLRSVVQAATDAALELSGAEFGAFFYNVVDDAGESYLLYTLSGAPREQFEKFPMPRRTAVFGPTFEGSGVVRSGDITKDPRYGQNVPYQGMPKGHLPVRSYLAVPVKARSGQVLGGLFYGHSKVDVFSQESEELVCTVAAQAAIAIENVRLHEQLKRKVEEVETTRIRERKEAKRVADVLESTSDAVFILDREWRFVFLNERAVDLIAEGRELLGRTLWDALPGKQAGTFYDHYKDAMENRRKQDFVEFYNPLSLWLSTQVYPADEGVAVFFRDITKQKEDARLLEESAGRLKLAIAAGRLGTWSWNLETDMLDLDDRAAEIFLWHPNVPVSRGFMRDRIVAMEDRKSILRDLKNALDGSGVYDTVYRIICHDGSLRWVHSLGTTIFDQTGAGKPIGMIGTVQDISERKQQEDKLKQTEMLAATGRLAATIAHEINNPLEAITNLIYLAKNNPEIPQMVAKQLEIADKELARISQIAQQTLGFYRDSSHPSPVDLAVIIGEMVSLFERRLQYKKLRCKVEIKGDLKVIGWQGELRQALSNLFVNAIDASPITGTVLIRATSMEVNGAQNHLPVAILICDQGNGIPAEVGKKLFEPFFTTKKNVGTGLGLWVTKGIVEKHHGTIAFRSRTTAPSGSIFRIVLPRDKTSVPGAMIHASIQ